MKGIFILISVGIDTVEIDRIKKSIQTPRFFKVVFSELEIQHIQKKLNPQSIAARFCAKEAFSKALGTGFRGFGFKDVQVFQDYLGKPYIVLSEKLKSIMGNCIYDISLSLSHTKSYASAVVIIEKNSSNKEEPSYDG